MTCTRCLVVVCALFLSASSWAGGGSEGMASWYADSLQGNTTASGEPYDKNALTAAHRTFAFGTRVVVTRLDNDKQVTVVINDRGPYAKNRIIDLSRAAATALDMIDVGVVRVKLELVD